MSAPRRSGLVGKLALQTAAGAVLDDRRVRLLEEIGNEGSLSRAARKVPLSYRAAWDALEAMDSLADAPLVLRRAGGRHGGGTTLTEHGRRIVALYRDLQRSQQALVERAAADAEGGTPAVEPAAREHTAAGAGAAVPPHQPDRAQPGPAGALPRPALLTSARNQFVGRVASLSDIGGMVRIRVDLEGDPPIDAVVTPESVATMALAPGCEVMALVKAPWVTLCASAPRRRAGVNVLPGTIATLHRGGSVTRLTLTTAGRRIVSAAMPSDAGVLARLQRGSAAWARFAADAVLLATVA